MKCIFYTLVLIAFFTPQFPLNAKNSPYAVLRSRNTGMFSVYCDVIGVLKYYEDGKYSGVHVDFAKSGLYYDPSYGNNWWEYYSEPILIGNKKNRYYTRILKEGRIPSRLSYMAERKMTRIEVFELIQKYIHIKPHIQKKIESFVEIYFQDSFIIGVHYRGTDKVSEAPRVAYATVVEEIDKIINGSAEIDYKIFVATDEQDFLDTLVKIYGEKVCYNPECIRSINGKPLHTNVQYNSYKVGEDALIDCLLLSECDILIRTSSNLSLWSTFFNPYMEVIELSNRY